MTTYTFNPTSTLTLVDWNTPSDWLPQLTPNSSDADVVIPEITSGGQPYNFGLTISKGENIVVNSLSVTDQSLTINGNLTINSGLTLSVILQPPNITEPFSINGNFLLNGDLTVVGTQEVIGNLSVGGSLFVNGELVCLGTIETATPLYNLGAIGADAIVTPSFFNSGRLVAARFLNVEAPSGFGNLAAGTLAGGTFEMTADATLFFDTTQVITTDASDIILDSSKSVFKTSGGDILSTVSTIAAPGTLSLAGGIFHAGQSLLIDGNLVIDNATFFAPGLTIEADGTLAAAATVGVAVANDGEINVSNTGAGVILNNYFPTDFLLLQNSVSGTGTIAIAPYLAQSSPVYLSPPSYGTVELAGACSNDVAFEDFTGTVVLDEPLSFTGHIAGFSSGVVVETFGIQHQTRADAIIVDGVNLANLIGSMYVGDASGGTLILQEGTQSLALDFTGSYALSDFGLAAGPQALSTLPPSLLIYDAVVPCFARGTHVATADGPTQVEMLAVGDQLLTAGGRLRPVRWIGHRHVNARAHPSPAQVWPVRVLRRAFHENVPHCDLWLSPDHSVFLDGLLIPIKHLMNGASITQIARDDIEYWHIELDQHDILLAEGLPAETYLDTGNRGSFANGRAEMTLHPEFRPLTWDHACARLCTTGPVVVAARRRLLARLPALGYRLTSRRPWHLEADGKIIPAARITGALHQFILSAGTRMVRIISDVTIPAGTDPDNDDCRALGVRIDGILTNGCTVPLNSPSLRQGFYATEGRGTTAWRWTNGDAVLTLVPTDSPLTLQLIVGDVPPRLAPHAHRRKFRPAQSHKSAA